jgi:hypothetical protein
VYNSTYADNAYCARKGFYTKGNIIMTTEQIAQAIADFATNLKNSTDMTDRRDAVEWLAEKIGPDSANNIADIFGLKDQWYKA